MRCKIASSLILVAVAGLSGCLGQAHDGDDQFQAYHQDIGRLSSASSPVAPSTSIRHHQPAAAAVVAPTFASAPAPVHLASPTHHHQAANRQASIRKANRVVLAVRPHEPLEPVSPAQVVARAPATIELEPPVQPTEPQLTFRAPVPAAPISSHHAALVAQVAAEREHASAASHAPDFGPISAQVQPPPVLAPVRHVEAAAAPAAFVATPEEPLPAPSFEHVLSNGCPHKGVFSWENKDHCDRYYMCTNGTFTEEACPNGLAYSQMGAVYQHCAYNWNVQCANKKTAGPIASPGCPWQFGIFPIESNGRCSIDYFACEWGVPERKRCSPEGLFYDDRIKGCQWADQLGCKSEALLNFKCPPEDEDNPYWPYPRYYHTNRDVVVCVNEQPRLVHCTDEQLVEPSSLACVDIKKKKPKLIG